MRRLHAFSLIEMLVVMVIMATLSGMILIAYEENEVDLVLADAYELQTVLQRARTLAMSSGKTYGVTFHIENAGDGSVLRNMSVKDDLHAPGRHWYCIIGPDNADRKLNPTKGRKSTAPPIAQNNGSYQYNFFSLENYEEAVQKAQVGQRHYLSRGVRFLALGDEDKLHSFDDHETYPRPWFGYFDADTGTLYPWGAYNRDIDEGFSAPNTGFDYEGLDGPIPYNENLDTNVNPGEVWGRLYFDEVSRAGATSRDPKKNGKDDKSVHTHFGFKGNYIGPDTSRYPGAVRPLANGYWCDFMIIFSPSGDALFADSKARYCYFHSGEGKGRGRSQLGFRNYNHLTGGYYFTLCKDVDPYDAETYIVPSSVTGGAAYNKFKSVEDAFDSISPFVRVYVNKITGQAEVQTNAHPYMSIKPEDMLQKKPYPRGFDQ